MRVLAPTKVLAGAAEEEVELGRADEDEGTEADEEVTGEATAVVGAGASLEMTGALLGVATLAIELETTASVLAAVHPSRSWVTSARSPWYCHIWTAVNVGSTSNSNT